MSIASFGYEDLIAWSEGLHVWQRDALRRLLTGGELTDADIGELAELAESAHRSAEDVHQRANPADLDDVRPESGSLPVTCLFRVRDISRVGALAPGPVEFAAEGLTVVYGDSASGKSSIVRILKRACRALDRGSPIRPSIHEAEEGPLPQATLDYLVGGESKSKRWIEGLDAGEHLATVSVFDSGCARQQVEKANHISYRPAILQVFKDLATASERVRDKLEATKRALGARDGLVSVLEEELGADTEAGRFVVELSALTDTTALDRLTKSCEEKSAELEELRRALGENPLERADAEAARGRRIASLQNSIEAAVTLLNDEASQKYRELQENALAAQEAAQAAGEAFESGVPLEGLRSAAWKVLWEAARRFSEAEAYPADAYPVVRDGVLCVLCQQPLTAEAKTRLRSFEAFVRSEAQEQAERARREAEVVRERIGALVLPRSQEALGDAGLRQEGVGQELRRFLVLARVRRRALLRMGSGSTERGRFLLPTVPDLAAVRRSLTAEEARLRAAAVDATRREMEQRYRELSGPGYSIVSAWFLKHNEGHR